MTFWRANIRQIKYERLFFLNGVLLNCLTVSSRWDRENLCKACLYVRKTALSPENIEWQISNGIPICLFVFILYFLFAIFYLLYKVTLVQFLVARENENKANFREITTKYKKKHNQAYNAFEEKLVQFHLVPTSTQPNKRSIFTGLLHFFFVIFYCFFFFIRWTTFSIALTIACKLKRDKNARVKAMAKWRSN